MVVEKILYVLMCIDCLAYLVMSITAKMKKHKRKWHFWMKNIPLSVPLALSYLFIVAWLGYALYRLGVLP